MSTTGSTFSDALTGSTSSTVPVSTTTATIDASGNPIFSTVQSTLPDPVTAGITGSAANINPILLDQGVLDLLMENVARRFNLPPLAADTPLAATTIVPTPTVFGTVPSGMTEASASTMFGTVPSGMTGASAPTMFGTNPSGMTGVSTPNLYATAGPTVSTVNVIHPSGMMGASAPTMSAPLHTSRIMPTAEKPPKFGGEGFKRWQQKMLFYLTMIGFVNFVKEDEPSTPAETETNFVVRAAYDNWHNGDYLCKGFLLSSLEDSLSNVYANVNELMFCVVRNCFRVQIALTRVVVSLAELILSEKLNLTLFLLFLKDETLFIFLIYI
ncbi:hypothetical protein CASFOL_026217 [Castilleja foliolosa]|uniref:Uncharacterized protein n=1 Tax=Castilleja foliolosa TaxID=1961234 RepID=A0ABD3CMD3_9LAMI